jgi:anti-sigma factor (TIGR02949 family)
MKREDACAWARERMEAWLDGELPAAEAERFARHLDGCGACAREAALARHVVSELRALPPLACPETIMARVEARRSRGAPAPRPLARLRGWLDERVAVLARPAMATMLVALAAISVFVLTQRDRLPGGAGDYTRAEVETARAEVMVAFAYVGKYSRMTGSILREEMDQGLVKSMDRAMDEAEARVVAEVLVKPIRRAVVESQKEILETLPVDGRSQGGITP